MSLCRTSYCAQRNKKSFHQITPAYIMKHLFSIFAVALLIVGCTANKQSGTEQNPLRFHDGKFRIAQFTDFHWEAPSSENAKKRETVLQAVASQKPDLCVLTGDIVTGGDPVESWREVISAFEDAGVPYVVIMGNHDPENLPKDSIYSLIETEGRLHVGQRGPADIDGMGNCVIRIQSENSDSTAAAVYCIDSGSNYHDRSLSDYDNIHYNQIDWYVEESRKLTAENGGKPLPALAYFHICVPEYNLLVADSTKYFGHSRERCCPSDINSGFFSTVLEQGDVMGMFVGHDHSNDFIGLWKRIALGYGRQSGVMAESETTPPGCRIVELREGCRAFDSWTWSAEGAGPKFYYPTGITSEMEEKSDYLEAADMDVNSLKNGISYTYYEGSKTEKTTDDMIERGEVKDKGVMKTIDITQAPAEDHFGYVYEGYFNAEVKGIYIFSILSDDGSKLFIDGKCVIDLDGSHSMIPTDGYVALEKGLHKFRLQYFEDYMGQKLQVELTTRNSPREILPKRLLYSLP